MKQHVPIVTTFVLGLFGLLGIEADEQAVLALVNGLLMAGAAVWAIWQANQK